MPASIINTPGTKPISKVTSIAREVEAWSLKTQGVVITIFYGSTTWPDHNNLRCLDIMTSHAEWRMTGKKLTGPESIEFGNKLRSYLVLHAKRLGLNGLIWNHKVTGFPHVTNPPYRGPYGIARAYTQPNQHTDHIHIEVDSKAYIEPEGTSPVIEEPFWDGKSFPGANHFILGKTDPAIPVLNARLTAHGFASEGLVFTETVKSTVRKFQEAQGWSGAAADGIPGPTTWARLMSEPKPVVPVPVPTPPVVVTPDPDPVVVPPVVVKEPLKGVRIVNANFQWSGFSTSPPEGDRVKTVIDAIKKQKPSIIIAQEVSRITAAKAAALLGADWSYQRAQGDGKGLNAIFWNSEWELVGDIQDDNMPSYGQMQRTAICAKFRHKKTGKTLSAASTHLANQGGKDFNPGVTGSEAQAGQGKFLVKIYKSIKKMLLGGDWNNKSNKTGPRAILIDGGFIPDNKQVKIENLDKDAKDGIDALFTKGDVKITSAKVFTLGSGSDHDGRIYTVDIA